MCINDAAIGRLAINKSERCTFPITGSELG